MRDFVIVLSVYSYLPVLTTPDSPRAESVFVRESMICYLSLYKQKNRHKSYDQQLNLIAQMLSSATNPVSGLINHEITQRPD